MLKLGRTPGAKNKATRKWEAYWLNKNKAKAFYQAKMEYLAKNPLESLKTWLKDIDVLELAGTLALTYVIHNLIISIADFFDRAKSISDSVRVIAGTPDAVKWLPWGSIPLIGNFYDLPWIINTLLNKQEVPDNTKEVLVNLKKELDNPNTDSFFIWVLSFGIAYYIQKHGITDIFNTIKGFLGVATAA